MLFLFVQCLQVNKYQPSDNESNGCLLVKSDACEQRLQPAGGAFAMGIQEGDHLTRGDGRPLQPSTDQAGALLHPYHPNGHLQPSHVLLQLTFQEVYTHREGGNIHYTLVTQKIIPSLYDTKEDILMKVEQTTYIIWKKTQKVMVFHDMRVNKC